ncbi:MAG: hypothetical protein AB7O67_22945 [Vicinamibacterales bacterium]
MTDDRTPRYDRERAVAGELDEDAQYTPGPCIVCGEAVALRCGRCHEPICHHHGPCPNGCDDPVPDTLPFGRP